MRKSVLALWLAIAIGSPQSAFANPDPAAGTVFIRLIGSIRVLSGGEDGWQKQVLLDLPQVEVATGSGFIVSAQGWVITNHHVISGEKIKATVEGVKVEITINAERIEVIVPGDRGGPNAGPRRYAASLYASDPDLDLAVLSLGAQELPYVPLGDSDVVTAGEPVHAVGYPFGAGLEIGRTLTTDTVPSVSINSGSISALRRDDNGEIRYLQTSAQLNPGNSGGPIVDPDGYVVAVAQLALAQRAAVGFGIPVNLVKRFLKRNGLDQNLPTMILSLGPYLDAVDKGVRLRLPEGLEDASPVRLRIDASMGDVGGAALHIDRVASRLTLEQLETTLLNGETFEPFQASGPARRSARSDKERRVVSGFVRGTEPATNREVSLLYSLVDLGREKILARYIGSSEAVALNRSVLQASLADLEVKALLTDEVARPAELSLATMASPTPGGPAMAIPSGWMVEAGMPSGCAGLTAPVASFSTSPPGDFTVSFRAGWWPNAPADVAIAARACAPQAGSRGDASYSSRVSWSGNTYVAQGLFVASANGGFWHLEMMLPQTKSPFITALFDAWVKANAHP